MKQNTSSFENSMNIHILSFTLPKNVVSDKDDIRVSITTYPDQNKQHFSIEGKKINNANHVFSLNITNLTNKAVIVFRKKNVIGNNPIVASTSVILNEFKNVPSHKIESGTISSDVKTIDIFYPLQLQKKEENREDVQRKILGKMQVQLSFAAPFLKIDKKNINVDHSKINKMQKIKLNKKNGYEKLSEKNGINCSYLI